MSTDEIKAIESSVLNLQNQFGDLTAKLNTFATTQQTTADRTAARLDALEKAVQESHDKTQEQLRVGEEMIQSRLATVGDFNGRVEEAIARLTQGIDKAQEAASSRTAAGEQRIIAGEQRLAQTEQKVADALGGITAGIEALRGEISAAQQAAQAASATATAAAAMATTSRATPSQGAAVPGQPATTGPNWPGTDPWEARPASDPWAGPRAAAAPWTGALGRDLLREKDFSSIDKFDGTMSRFADWSDRMAAKMRRAHPRLDAALTWAEAQTEPITAEVERAASDQEFNVEGASAAMFDILLAKTTGALYDKRKNVGDGRGFELWRVMKRDYGMDSTDAQYAKMQMFMQPARCSSIAELGAALDKWEALGTQIGKPIDEDFKLIALKELVPKSVHDLMSTQVQLRRYPEAIAYVRRQVTEQYRANQVAQVQKQGRQGPTPMDVGSVRTDPLKQLLAAIERVSGAAGAESGNFPDESTEWDAVENPLDKIIAAIKGHGKGKKGAQQPRSDTRTCFRCGKTGHIMANCPGTAAGDERPGGQGKGKGKGKYNWGKGLASLNEEQPEPGQADGGITLSCLTRESDESGGAPDGGHPVLNTVANKPESESWGEYVKVEVAIDSGAAECVCGPGHFPGASTEEGKSLKAGVQYICADGGRIPNLGEQNIQSMTTEGTRFDAIFQVTQVDRPLLSVSKLTKAGHLVKFEGNGGYIVNGVTGNLTWFRLQNDIYILDLWVRKSGGSRQ